MPDDIVDAAQKNTTPVPPWSPMGTNNVPSEPPPEPAPAPVNDTQAPKFVTVQTDTEPPSKPNDTEKIQNAGMVLDTILGTPSQMPSQPPINPTFPMSPPPEMKNNPPKKKNISGLVIGLLLFLGALGTGVFYITKPGSLADTRGQAAGGVNCNNAGGKCVPNNYICTPSGTISSSNDCGTGNKCVGEAASCRPPTGTTGTPIPTRPPDPTPTRPTSHLSPCEEAGHMCVNSGAICTYLGNPAPVYGQSCNNSLYKCVPEASQCTGGGPVDTTPSPFPTNTPQACQRVELLEHDTNASMLTIKQAWANECLQKCVTDTTELFVSVFKCAGINLAEGCQNDQGTLDPAVVGQEYGEASISCGTIQVDVGCKNAYGTWGTVAFVSKSATVACAMTPTPRPPGDDEPPVGVCANIKIYKAGVQVDPTMLLPGDAVILAVRGTENPTKARFRVNGAAWTETTAKNTSGEYILDFTIPGGITDFVIEAEVFDTGIWK